MVRPAVRSPRVLAALCVALSVTAACGGGGDGSGPDPRQPGSLELVTGDGQAAAVGTVVAVPPAVRVLDLSGAPLPGVAVSFTPRAGTVAGSPAITGEDGGAAATSWTLGTVAGSQRLVARVASLAGDSVSFTATALPGPAAVAVKLAGDGQDAVLATALPVAPAVRVTDAHGNPVAGVTVTFQVASGGGMVTGASPVSAADGLATLGGWVLGPVAGRQTVTVTLPGGAAPVATFAANALPLPPASLTILAGDGQSAEAGDVVAVLPRVRVADAQGQPIPGILVTFTVAAGGGTVSHASRYTDAVGETGLTYWQLGTVPDTNRLTVAIAGSAVPSVSFTALGVTGPPTRIVREAGDAQFGFRGAALAESLAVRITDRVGNPVAGVGLTFTVATGAGSVSPGQGVTDTSGLVRTAWTLGPGLGPQSVLATASSLSQPISTTFTATAEPPAWTGTVSRDWADAANWTSGQVPGAGDTAYVPATARTPLLSGDVTVTRLHIKGGDVEVGPHTLTVLGDFSTATGGTLTMTHPAAVVDLNGLADFAGGSQLGRLTAGTLRVAGEFRMGPFAASGTHRTIIDGAGPVESSLVFGRNTYFNDLEVATAAPAVTLFDVIVHGRLTISTPTVVGGFTQIVHGLVTTVPGSHWGCTICEIDLDSLAIGGTQGIAEVIARGGTVLPPFLTTPGPLVRNYRFRTGGPVTLVTPLVGYRVTVESGTLVLGGHAVDADSFTVSGPGSRLDMTDPADTIRTTSFVAAGADSRGWLTAGFLQVVSLVQQNLVSDYSFTATGAHTTRFVAGLHGRPAEVLMDTPGAAASHFQRLELTTELWIGRGAVVAATGPLVTVGAGAHGARNVWGFPTALEAAGVDVDGFTLVNVPLRITSGILTRLDNVTFTSLPGDAVQLTVSHPGTGTPFVMQGLTFSPTLTTGLYLDAVDSDGTAPPLTLEVHSTLAPGVGAAGTRTSAGPGPVQAQVTWP